MPCRCRPLIALAVSLITAGLVAPSAPAQERIPPAIYQAQGALDESQKLTVDQYVNRWTELFIQGSDARGQLGLPQVFLRQDHRAPRAGHRERAAHRPPQRHRHRDPAGIGQGDRVGRTRA